MGIIWQVPFVLRIIISLFIILLVNKFTDRLWVAVITGTLVIAVWTGQSLQGAAAISWARFSSANNIFLIIVIFQVIWFSGQMSETGVMKSLVTEVQSRVSQRSSIAILPAVIGLLPMPGGAIFSAPLVDDCDYDKTIDPLLKTRINYWFRHVWEYWWPMYPGVLLAVDITGLSIGEIMVLQFPLSIVSITAGIFFMLRKIPGKKNSSFDKSHMSNLVLLVSPIFLIIGSYALIRILVPAVSSLNKYLPMCIGIFTAQVMLQVQRPLSFSKWIRILFSWKTVAIVLVVVLIRIYGAFIEAKLPDGTLLMTHMREELRMWGISYFSMIMLLPFISGMTTGLAIGFVGASFPIVMSLIGINPDYQVVLATTVLAFGSGYVGMLLSPVHVCLIVTNEHFKTSILDSLVRLVKPAFAVLIASIIMYWIIRVY